MAAVTICSDFGNQKVKSVTVSTVSPSICHEVMGLDAVILVFWMLSFRPAFSVSCFTSALVITNPEGEEKRLLPPGVCMSGKDSDWRVRPPITDTKRMHAAINPTPASSAVALATEPLAGGPVWSNEGPVPRRVCRAESGRGLPRWDGQVVLDERSPEACFASSPLTSTSKNCEQVQPPW